MPPKAARRANRVLRRSRHPFAPFAECDQSGDSEIAPGEAAELVVSRPNLKPEDSNILVDVPTSETESHVVSLASLKFQ